MGNLTQPISMPTGPNGPQKIEIIIAPALQMPRAILDGFIKAFRKTFQKYARYMHDQPMAQLLSPEINLAIAIVDGEVEAGFFFKETRTPAGPCASISALFNISSKKALALLLLAAMVKWENIRLGEKIGASADVRVLPDGTTNDRCARVLSELGFAPRSINSHEIIGDARDAHLGQTAEADGTYRALEMYARPQDLWRRSGDVLRAQANGLL